LGPMQCACCVVFSKYRRTQVRQTAKLHCGQDTRALTEDVKSSKHTSQVADSFLSELLIMFMLYINYY